MEQAHEAVKGVFYTMEQIDMGVVLPDIKYTDSDGEEALRRAMYICGVQNNPVTRYTADAIAEKLTREAAEAALEEREVDE